MRIPDLSDETTHAGQLRALRDILAFHIDDCDSKRDLAALSLRYMAVVERLAQLNPDEPAVADPLEAAISNVVNLR